MENVDRQTTTISELMETTMQILRDERVVLKQIIESCPETLNNNYSLKVDEWGQGNFITTKYSAAVWVKVDKYNVALSLIKGVPTVKLIVFSKTRKGFDTHLVAEGWSECRVIVSLDAIIEAIVNKLKDEKSQITSNTERLLSAIS